MNIYFSGIGGVGIGPLAEIALDAGYEIQGSDPFESPMTERLVRRGIPFDTDQSGMFLKACHESKPIDWFIYTSALPSNHPELVLAKTLGIKTAKRDELLAFIIAEKNLTLIAVSGSHGKTTTSGMLVWTLQQLGLPVSYSIGAPLQFGPSGAYVPDSQYFVYECDEFDRNFLHFSPELAIITSIEYDHPDTYPTATDYYSAFTQFTAQSSGVIMWQKDATFLQAPPKNSWLLGDSEALPLALIGNHNRRNGTLVMKALEFLNISSFDARQQALEAFPGTGRRFEKLADNLYSDYGHHPTEIATTLQLAREVSDSVVLVYQPHQNIRQHQIQAEYHDKFTNATRVYWLPTYLSREDPTLPILTPQELTKDIINRDAITISAMDESLWQAITRERANGALVLCMGAGDIDPWLRAQLNKRNV